MPSLGRGSAQLVWIDKVKEDPDGITISWSPMIFKHPNADSTQGPLQSNLY